MLKQKKLLGLTILQHDILKENIKILFAINTRTKNSTSVIISEDKQQRSIQVIVYKHFIDNEVKFNTTFNLKGSNFYNILDLAKKFVEIVNNIFLLFLILILKYLHLCVEHYLYVLYA